ncbi:hypothetical protein MYX07_03090 [Patescibacteria group bacterium AH-259-L07]|nr:hypothetical protein [Patescibacteria group bacterium AH-259-L07]
MNQETKICQNCKQQFTIEPDDFDFYKKIKVPPPTFCPECRLVRRLAWRNESTLYRRKCDAPGHSEEVISMYPKDKSVVVYDQKYWWSDAWDELKQVGQEYDFSRPFFEQFRELLRKAPMPALTTEYPTMVRSEYSNWAGDLKNCYLIVDADLVEDSAYGSGIVQCKDCYDIDFTRYSELCYFGFDLEKCFEAIYSVSCKDCYNIYFCKDCVGCSYCFGCVNLRNKKYYIFNQPYSKEEYEKEIEKLNLRSYKGFANTKVQVQEIWDKYPKRSYRGLYNKNVSGDYIYHSKNTHYGFLVTDVEDSKYIALTHSKPTKGCYDYTDFGDNVQNLYECMTIGLGGENIKFSHLVFRIVRDIEYSYWCMRSSHLFGCVGLKDRQYCILNKQYSKEEYEKLVPQIIQHMKDMPYKDKKVRVYKYGEFFPPELSPFAYNETIAQEYFPLTKQQTTEQGYTWKDPEKRDYEITIQPQDLPDHIKEVKDDILDHVIGCEHKGRCNHQCRTAFRIIPQEFQFYQKMQLPLPRLCPSCRHYERIAQRNPLKLWHRTCQCAGEKSDNEVYTNTIEHFHKDKHCPNEFETTYAPERKEIVYCEKCYQAEVV